jgi:hypothetical protein
MKTLLVYENRSYSAFVPLFTSATLSAQIPAFLYSLSRLPCQNHHMIVFSWFLLDLSDERNNDVEDICVEFSDFLNI